MASGKPAPLPHSQVPNTPTALAVAVNKALRVSRQRPSKQSTIHYLLAATLMSAGAMAQAQGFLASIDLQNLDGSNGFVINGVDEDDLSGGSVSRAGILIVMA